MFNIEHGILKSVSSGFLPTFILIAIFKMKSMKTWILTLEHFLDFKLLAMSPAIDCHFVSALLAFLIITVELFVYSLTCS